MKATYCDCCKRTIGNDESVFSIKINKQGHLGTEHILTDTCVDCYERFHGIIVNAERWRKNQQI